MEFGIITPLIVNKSDNSYEIISGHRRWQIAKELKLKTIPVYVKELSKEDAVINFVDCNLCREKNLPSEKACDELQIIEDNMFKEIRSIPHDN